ncbi:poly [ADP-ribose] polymerase [Nilaparvata lugens]|uniref:poly [ADP-ribose] polymerase n=1 Tax=Nilaparvata lugens TaxID=108931 RepID=UPI00193E0C94|nr:poly [ADP-ribose] polymerase [Nilaparvata lugens]
MPSDDEGVLDYPYKAEYAKSGRASCKGCKSTIEKATLRLAVMVKSPVFDGKMAHWYHFMCFFSKQRPKSVGDIAHYSDLRWEDQQKIQNKIAESGPGSAVDEKPAKGKGKKATKRGKQTAASNELKDFLVEYAKSSRATCKGCDEKIVKEEVRISKKEYESNEAKRFGGIPQWHHPECFNKLRAELEFYASGDQLPGYDSLRDEDKNMIKNLLPKIDVKKEDAVDGEAPAKKAKVEKAEATVNEAELKKQSQLFFKNRDLIKMVSEEKKKFLQDLLEYNNQEIPAGVDRMLDRLADLMSFGVPAACTKCKGQLLFKTGVGYACHGNLTEWVKCQEIYEKPKRTAFKLPKEIKKNCAELAKLKFKTADRLFVKSTPSTSSSSSTKQENGSEPKVKSGRSYPMKGMEFMISGLPKEKTSSLKIQVEKLGGKVVPKAHENLAAVISTEGGLAKISEDKKSFLETEGIQVVPVEFIDKCAKGDICDHIMESSIVSWGKNPKKRIEKTLEQHTKSQALKSAKSMYSKSGSSKVKLKVQGGTAVDPDSGLQDEAHVYKSGGDIYSVVLGLTDIQRDKNSYYKMQILESNDSKRKKYWLFRSWGRIGTSTGGDKVESYSDLDKAISKFSSLFEEKSGNMWQTHKDFKKVPGKMYILDMDYSDNNQDVELSSLNASNSSLSKPVQELLLMLFDINLMKKAMVEFELDLEKMPLGKISKYQILKAYSVLSKLQGLIEKNDGELKVNQKPYLIEATNQFYTLVPHFFGADKPTLLDDIEMIKSKMEMLDSLLEMQVAYSFLSSGEEQGQHTLDAHYGRLNADIEALERACKEFEIIEQYVTNTHAATHQQYKLEILDVFKVIRKDEEKRFKPFKKLPNRKLLWHGSRLTNWAGILSQGLRIAPPEAPTTGYMFGKGIYFADMVSKSANYCMTSPGNNVGLLYLCEVALGNMYHRSHADYIEKLPAGHHSCKGVGRTGPDPSSSVHIEDGLEVPIGKPVDQTQPGSTTSLLYNEYIVYDRAQVKSKYLIKLKFNYNY